MDVTVLVADSNLKLGVTFGACTDAFLSDSVVRCVGAQPPSGSHPLAPLFLDWDTKHQKGKKPWEIAVRLLFADHLAATTASVSSRPISLPIYLGNTLRVWRKHSTVSAVGPTDQGVGALARHAFKERDRLENAMLYGLSLIHMLFQIAEVGRMFPVGFPLASFVRLKASLLFMPKPSSLSSKTPLPLPVAELEPRGDGSDLSFVHTSSEHPFMAFAQSWSIGPVAFIRRRMATLMLFDIVREWLPDVDGLTLLNGLLDRTWLWMDMLIERDLFLISSIDSLTDSI
jgi:hypothetical protein